MIARKGFLIASTRIFVRFLGWIGLVVLAKMWGNFAPEAMGIIGFAMSFLALFSIIGNLGFDKAHVKRVSEGKDLGRCIGTFITIKLLLTALMIILIIGSIFVWTTFFNGGFTDATTVSVIFVFILYYVVFNLSHIFTYTFEGKGEMAKRQLSEIFEGIVKTPSTLLVVIAGVSIAGVSIPALFEWPSILGILQDFIARHPVGSLAMTYVFGAAGITIVGILLMRSYPVKKPTKAYMHSYFVFALPMIITSVISVISTNIDKITIGYFWDATEVGYYFTVQQVTIFIQLISSSLSFILFPTLSSYHSGNKIDLIKKTIRYAERHISMILIPPVFFILIYSESIIKIMLSASFLPATSVMIVLAFFKLFSGLNVPYVALLSGINKPQLIAKNTFFVCTSNVVLNLIFVPKEGILSSYGIQGALGAAVATILSTFIGLIRLRYIAYKTIGFKGFPVFLIKHFIAGILMSISLFLINSYILQGIIFRWYLLLLMSLLGLGIYLLILYLIKEFTKEDFWFYLDVINMKKMIKYIRGEIKR